MAEKAKLRDIPDELRAGLAEMLVEGNGEVLDLIAALTAAVGKNLEPLPAHELAYEADLEPAQALWVSRAIDYRYARTRFVNSPLLNTQDAPAFPDIEAVKRSALKQLTREQVDYMMESGRPSFSFQVKLVTPKDRLYLLMKLINDQQRKIKGQKDLKFMEFPEHYLCKNRPAEKMEWQWEFVQADQVIQALKKDDPMTGDLKKRLAFIKSKRPKGMRGVDRYTWATLMADSLDKGRPLDVINLANNKYNRTVLDEEGEMRQYGGDQNPCMIVGEFSTHYLRPELQQCLLDPAPEFHSFRTSVSGPIEGEAVMN